MEEKAKSHGRRRYDGTRPFRAGRREDWRLETTDEHRL